VSPAPGRFGARNPTILHLCDVEDIDGSQLLKIRTDTRPSTRAPPETVPAGDAQHPVVAGFQALPEDGGQQCIASATGGGRASPRCRVRS